MKKEMTKDKKVVEVANSKRRILSGLVVSDKMQKSVVVKVDRYVKHAKYGKFYTISKRYKAHDENNEYKVGDKVEIEECKPISKDKSFIVIKKI